MANKTRVKHMGRRGLSFFLALVMCISLVQITAFAAGETSERQIEYAGGSVYYKKDGTQDTSNDAELGKNDVVVELSKTLEGTEKENEFIVTLQVKTNQKLVEIPASTPDAAVVLVLDVSNSMDDCMTCGNEKNEKHNGHQYESRLSKAQAAARNFLNKFANETNAQSGDRRMVSIVTFGSNARNELYAQKQVNWVDVRTADGMTKATEVVNGTAVAHGNSKIGGTNIEGGLMLAKNILNAGRQSGGDIENVSYLYTILLTDGNPTYYVDGSSTSTESITGAVGGWNETSFYDVKDVGNEAKGIKDITNLSKLYSICFGSVKKNGKTTAVWDTKPFGKWNRTPYKATPPTTGKTTVGDWLRAFSTKAYNGGTSGESLFDSFNDIAGAIAVAAKAWRVNDVMGENVSFVEEVPVVTKAGTTLNNVTVPAADNRSFVWNILASNYDPDITNVTMDGDKMASGTLGYTYKYRVRLNNLNGLQKKDGGYFTNDSAELKYMVANEDGTWPTDEKDLKPAWFVKPTVNPMEGKTLAFTKTAFHNDKEVLSGAAFTLTHDSDCPCGVESSKSYTSEYKNSKVTFENIPSGHKYVLEEETAPTGYVKLDKTYPVTVAWGQLTVGGTDEMFDGSTFKNKADPQKKDLVITKNWLPNILGANVTSIEVTVVGTITKDGKAVEVYRQNHTITGNLNESSWTGTIKDLPTMDQATNLHIAYTVTETANDNYKLATNSGVKEGEKLSVTLENQTTRIKTIEVAKVWGDASSSHPQVTLGLFAGNSKTSAKTVTLPKNGAWSEKVEVDAYDGNDQVDYTVKELDPATNTYVDSGRIVLGGVTYNVYVKDYTVTNTPAQAFTESVSGTKTWVDGEGSSGTRPSSITVKLYANGTEVASTAVTSTDGWAYRWNNLPKYALEDSRDTTGVLAALKKAGIAMNGVQLDYSVDEVAVDGYDKSGTGYDITNTIRDDLADVKVTKVWNDGQNAEDTRPDSVKLILHRSVTKNGTTVTDDTFNEYYVFEQVAGSYQSREEHTFQDLDVYDADGFKYTYTVTEDGVNDNDKILAGNDGVKYGVSYDQESLTVTNALGESSDTVKVRVEKLWKDDANADGTRPDSISITVAGKTVTLDGTVDANGEIEAWVAEFELPRFDGDGKKITYTASDVAEVKAAKYQTGKVEAAAVPGYSFAFVVTNELEQKHFDITVEKDWNTETGIKWEGFPKNAAHPDSVEVVLSGDGKTYPLTLNETNSWTNKQENLPRYDKDGKVISYAVKEVSVSGYQPSGTEKANWKLDEATGNYTISIGNTFIQEQTSVSGQKYWKDGDSVSNRPASIQVGLLANGTLVETKTVTANNGWQYAFKELPLYSGWPFSPSTVIKYTVRELNGKTPVEPNGTITYESPANSEKYTYTVTYSGSNIFNTRSTDTVEFVVNKVWIGPASSDVAFGLYQNGTLVDTVSGENMHTLLNSEHVWKGVFAKQPKYDANGNVYEYTVKELGDDDAVAEITENGQTITIGGKEYTVSGEKLGTTFVITNKVEQEYTTISGEKKWEGVPGSLDLPHSIQIGLYSENGQLVDLDGQENPVAVRADSEGKWTFSFQNVPVYALENNGDGHTIRYTVKEVGADSGSIRHGDDHYTVTSGTEDNGYTVTNTYRSSDEYKYFVVVNYVTHKQDGTDAVDGEYIYQQTTEVKKNDTAKVTPPATLTHDGHEFTYDADNEGNLTEKEITAPGTYKLVLWYERTEEVSPDPKPEPKPDPGSDVDISVKKVWNDDDSDLRPDSISVQLYRGGKAYGKAVTLSEDNSWKYTWYDMSDDYTWTVGEINVPDGYVSKTSAVGNRWTITNNLEGMDIQDPETPTTDLPDTDVPTSGDTGTGLNDPDVPKADVPKTGDATWLWAMAAAASGAGLVWLAISGRKRREEDA